MSARRLVDHLLALDAFSRWMGVSIVEAEVGRSVVRMTVRSDMVNGFGIGHGGIVFSLADSAFAFATNAAGRLSVAVDCTISFPAAVNVGDVLTATAIEETSTNKLAFCAVTVRNQHDAVVGHFRGTVFRTHREHQLPDVTP